MWRVSLDYVAPKEAWDFVGAVDRALARPSHWLLSYKLRLGTYRRHRAIQHLQLSTACRAYGIVWLVPGNSRCHQLSSVSRPRY